MITYIQKSQPEGANRLDAEHYQPEYLKAYLAKKSHEARKKAKELLEEAKRKVEEMIEKTN